jgi:hypothetical protein
LFISLMTSNNTFIASLYDQTMNINSCNRNCLNFSLQASRCCRSNMSYSSLLTTESYLSHCLRRSQQQMMTHWRSLLGHHNPNPLPGLTQERSPSGLLCLGLMLALFSLHPAAALDARPARREREEKVSTRWCG